MIGDRIVPNAQQTRAAQAIFNIVRERLKGDRPVVTIAGESGAGKSEIALELSRFYNETGTAVYVFQQDDYFFYPPKTNDDMRRSNIDRVGTGEVDLPRLDDHVAHFKRSPETPLTKPLVVFNEDRISEETIDPSAYALGIAEGTYTSTLENVDCRVFIDRTYRDTTDHRRERSRELLDEFSERVLAIEHEIISKHISRADIIVNKDYSVYPVDQ